MKENPISEDGSILFTKPIVQGGQTIEQAGLEAFGKLLIRLVRDHTIENMDGNIIAGRIGNLGEGQSVDIKSMLTAEQLSLVSRIIAETVDATLHHLLWTLDRVEWLDVVIETGSGTVASIKQVSDGLYGDLYTWIPQFTRQRYEPKV